MDHPEAAKARAAGKELGDIGQGHPDDEQDEQLAAAEALLYLATRDTTTTAGWNTRCSTEKWMKAGVTWRQACQSVNWARVGWKASSSKMGEADGIQSVDGPAGDDDHQGQGPAWWRKSVTDPSSPLL